MIAKKNLIKKLLVFLLIFGHALSFAAPKTKKKPRKRRTAQKRHYVQRNVRPDLKKVLTTAQPVFFKASKSSPKLKQKFLEEKRQIMAFQDPRESLFNDGVPLSHEIPQIDWPSVISKLQFIDDKVYLDYDNLKLLLTIDAKLQKSATKLVTRKKGIVSGSTAVIEPNTGRILALAQDSNKRNSQTSVSSRGPAASLIKIVTAAAAIEKENLSPYAKLKFRGGCRYLSRENWIEDGRRDRLKMSFDKAFGSSCNTFFARLALYHVGLSALKIYADKFMFNRPIPSDIKIQTSLFLLPDPETATPQEIAEAGAGFGATKLSPIHAALLSATVANDGIMMAPYLIEAAYDASGREVYRAHPKQIGRVVSKNTAEKLSTLMLATTAKGTSRTVFRRSGTRANIDDIGGKTGTLSDLENRQILYTWFSGIADINSPENIAIGTVIASPQNWVVRANAIAQTTIAQYFRLKKVSDKK